MNWSATTLSAFLFSFRKYEHIYLPFGINTGRHENQIGNPRLALYGRVLAVHSMDGLLGETLRCQLPCLASFVAIAFAEYNGYDDFLTARR